ncbi:Double-strand break repair protein mre11a [Geranomyces variabilis]|nr:Double-strand break repair protein mre11a [Geranomyces variabilis]
MVGARGNRAAARRVVEDESEDDLENYQLSQSEDGDAVPGANVDADPDAFRILLATDNHLGYMEKDPVRANDSFNAFEEVLKIARKHAVDFILLGGDLFHENKPSRKCQKTTLRLLRKYCLGDRPCPVEFLSDPKTNFGEDIGMVNYENPNLNVSMPVFSIHGNHDDPSGDGAYCALDILSEVGYVNYFGRQDEVDDISIKPILLGKGTSKLALYGLGNIRDERLHRTFTHKKVKMFRPSEDPDDWFNMMIIHQNRVAHGPTNYIPEHFLDDFLQLVFWGHEHDCLVDPVLNTLKGFHVTQPGSSVATSLCEGEAVPKHIAILTVKGLDFKIEPIRLQTVRPFVIDEVALKDIQGLRASDPARVQEFLQERVTNLIADAKEQWAELNPGLPDAHFPKPLIRLRVDYSGGFTTINTGRFGQNFVETVANPKDILQYHRRRAQSSKPKTKKEDLININAFIPEKLDSLRVEDLVRDYLSAQNLDILPENELGQAVKLFVEKEDRDAIKDFIDETIKRNDTSISMDVPVEDDDKFKEQIAKSKKQRAVEFDAEMEVRKKNPELMSAPRKPRGPEIEEDDDFEQPAVSAKRTPAKRAPARKAATAKPARVPGRPRGRAKAAPAPVIDDDSDEFIMADARPTGQDPISDDEEPEFVPTPTASKRKLPANMSVATPATASKRPRGSTSAATRASATPAPTRSSATPVTAKAPRQSKLNFGAPIALDDDDDDDDFASFARTPTATSSRVAASRRRI